MLSIFFVCLRNVYAFIILLGSYGTFCMSITGEDFFQKDYLKFNTILGTLLLINGVIYNIILIINSNAIEADMFMWVLSTYILGFSILFSMFIYLLKIMWHKIKFF